jgi:hypothetical protein
MKLSISAWNNDKYISLEEILRAMEHLVVGFTWWLRVLETAPEPGSEVLNDVNPELPMSYADLLTLVTPNLQIIDGEAIARDEIHNSNKYVIIRAIDSTSWDVETEMNGIVSAILHAYPDACTVEE